MFSFPEVIRNPRYENELESIVAPEREKAQAEHALDFALARDPERGVPVSGTPYRMWPVYIDRREYVVFYRVEQAVIYLDSIREGFNP